MYERCCRSFFPSLFRFSQFLRSSQVVAQACTFMRAERASIFFYDRVKNKLWSKVAKGENGVLQFSADTGIAGQVVKTGQLLNTRDPSRDPRFNSSVDQKTG